jgi:hypothetical protein
LCKKTRKPEVLPEPKARKRGSVRGLPLLNSGLWLSG